MDRSADSPAVVDTDWAFDRYEQVRHRLVAATFPTAGEPVDDVAAVAERFDGFVLDAFGVLNVGASPVPGAVARIAQLRRAGKRLVVLTNGATRGRTAALATYRALGFDFAPAEVVASRDLAAAALRVRAGLLWAAAGGPAPDLGDLGVPVRDLLADAGLFARADGFVLFSSAGWTRDHQARLAEALARRPRPVVVANPDLVAPREDGLSLEPGHYAHLLADELALAPEFYGKPYAGALRAARARLGPDVPPARIAMVGDSLHTDVLGARAAGMATILVTDHGLFRGRDLRPYVDRSGIVPDIVAAGF
ncbi:MAG: HAD-IIA family hydrolase [Alphaproteobacteria bacterium]|jgi:HAD superfamily hydrolase (TIGR01450 family)|nr:HAD-IIA family hydrolase [Alphaproteobacteria bacterium]